MPAALIAPIAHEYAQTSIIMRQRTAVIGMCECPQQVIDPEPSGHDPPLGNLVLAFETPAGDAEQNLDAVADLLGCLS